MFPTSLRKPGTLLEMTSLLLHTVNTLAEPLTLWIDCSLYYQNHFSKLGNLALPKCYCNYVVEQNVATTKSQSPQPYPSISPMIHTQSLWLKKSANFTQRPTRRWEENIAAAQCSGSIKRTRKNPTLCINFISLRASSLSNQTFQ